MVAGLRHAATHALFTREDVIIVATVSCIYGLGSPELYRVVTLRGPWGGEAYTKATVVGMLPDGLALAIDGDAGSQAVAARDLGMSRQALYRRMEKLGIPKA